MPIYEFRCLECGHLFEKLFLSPAQQDEEVSCPQCRSSSFERVISRVHSLVKGGAAGTEGPRLTTRSCSPGSSCATFELPGLPEK
ncbi:FmdB family zinc ribbon protein [Desulfovirgula thermocuniculi]|uniref:FmdB family zinc ribbon protein n=1 Tax=Desulfovirgula thermocuniculi TaxID=348842 RepID=UPI00041A6507|nr:zinc ribbon domain-containing protein [Desulfovirgula thermocuniculi]